MARYGRAVFISIVIGLTVIGTLPAQAKGLQLKRLVIRGPALTGPLSLARQQFGVPTDRNHPGAIALDEMLGRHPKSEGRPIGELGPRYALRYELELISDRVVVLRQDFYPYAEAGPVTFTPGGQAVTISPSEVGLESRDVYEVKPGWLPFPGEQVSTLQRYGLPSEAGAEPQPADERSGGQKHAALWLSVGVTTALVFLGMVLLFHRRGFPRRVDWRSAVP